VARATGCAGPLSHIAPVTTAGLPAAVSTSSRSSGSIRCGVVRSVVCIRRSCHPHRSRGQRSRRGGDPQIVMVRNRRMTTARITMVRLPSTGLP
jgi:hypothetical protein